MRVLWLADVLRKAGLTVHEYPGWRTRGSDRWGEVVGVGPLRGVVCHATAGSRTSSDAGEMRVLWETGSTSAPVPISQLYLSRSGQWTVGASGRCNHVLLGHKGPHKGFGNYQLLGVEAQNDNRGEPWTAVMLDSYRRGVAAICRHMGWEPWRVVAHREHQDGKSDPAGVDMTAFRRRVAELIKQEDDMPTVDEIAAAVWGWPVKSDRDDRPGTAAGKQAWTNEYAARLQPVARDLLANQRAILAHVAGRDVAAEVQQLLDAAAVAERAERQAELGELVEALEQAARERAELAELVQQAGTGDLTAQQVVDEIVRRLGPVVPAGDSGG